MWFTKPDDYIFIEHDINKVKEISIVLELAKFEGYDDEQKNTETKMLEENLKSFLHTYSEILEDKPLEMYSNEEWSNAFGRFKEWEVEDEVHEGVTVTRIGRL